MKPVKIRRYKRSISPVLRENIISLLNKEIKEDSISPAIVIESNGEVSGTKSLMMMRSLILFDKIRTQSPNLTEEQIFEVASIIGSRLHINARYFFLYEDGFTERGYIITDPGFDYSHTGDNL